MLSGLSVLGFGNHIGAPGQGFRWCWFQVGKIFLRKRRASSMDPVNATSGSGDQQVMQAQDAMTTPQHAGPVLEGETLGPTYQGPVRADEQPAPVLPNGVPPPVRRTMSDMVEMESLHYSPQANQATPVSDRGAVHQGQAVYAEAWPAQPDPNRDIHHARQPGFPASGFSWVAKLGEFLRTQVQGGMETRTTVTRQVMGPGGETGSMVVQQEQLQHTMSQASSPTSRTLQPATGASGVQRPLADSGQGREGDLPLFGPSARRVMEGWMQRAPLLYPQPSQPGPATDPGSSASIPREMVQEEVRRQVQEALNIQRKSIEDLREENRLLRTQVAAQPLRARAEDDGQGMAPTRAYFVDNEREDVPEGRWAYATGPRLPEGHRAYTAGPVLPEGHRAYTAGPELPEGHRAYAAGPELPEGPRAYTARAT